MSTVVAISGLVFAAFGLVFYPPPTEGWRASALAVLAMVVAVVVPFSIWLQGLIPVALAAVLALALLVCIAYRLSRYLTERMPSLVPPPQCLAP